MENKTNENWISCKKVGLPILEISSASMLMVIYKSKKVLVQTEYGEIFVAECEKIEHVDKRFKYKLNWFSYGTGSRKMKVVGKVVAWMDLPEKYKGE